MRVVMPGRVCKALVATGLAALAAGCASTPAPRDALCARMVDFANASPPASAHSVVLATAWGPTREHPDSVLYKDCEDAGWAAGRALCEYLLANTSTEFPQRNYRRALACLEGSGPRPRLDVSVERLDTMVWGHEVPGVRPGVMLGVEFVERGNETPRLRITAEAGQN